MGENERRSHKPAMFSDHHVNSNRITAEAARELSNGSLKLLTRIYKEIRHVAEEGVMKLEWGLCSPNQTMLNNITETLRADGFNVSIEDDGSGDARLIITW